MDNTFNLCDNKLTYDYQRDRKIDKSFHKNRLSSLKISLKRNFASNLLSNWPKTLRGPLCG